MVEVRKIDTFIVTVKSPVDDIVFSYLLECVAPEKKERILKMHRKQDAENSLIGEILAKSAIKKIFGIPIAKQEFSLGEHGKPYLKDFPNIHFNISHSGEYVVCCVSDKPIGIDIQKIGKYNPGVAKKVCNEKELKEIEESVDKAAEFTKLWAQKEAVLKRDGTGFANKDVKNCLDGEKTEVEKIGDYYLSVAT